VLVRVVVLFGVQCLAFLAAVQQGTRLAAAGGDAPADQTVTAAEGIVHTLRCIDAWPSTGCDVFAVKGQVSNTRHRQQGHGQLRCAARGQVGHHKRAQRLGGRGRVGKGHSKRVGH
jgi:hypothetical protein